MEVSDNFYPRPPRGGRLSCEEMQYRYRGISIHALREEGDCSGPCRRSSQRYFYPRPPRGGRRLPGLPVTRYGYFYPRPPRGGRPTEPDLTTISFDFYPRPPRGGRPLTASSLSVCARRFLSTPSARRATRPRDSVYPQPVISIHALREEGDSKNRDKISIFL